MPYQHFSARASSPTVDLVVDMGNPVLNSTVNGFLKVGPVGAAHAATQEAFKMFAKESVSKGDLERLVKKAGKEGLQWGVVAGVYSGDISIYLSSLCLNSVWRIVKIQDLCQSCVLFCSSTFVQTEIQQACIAVPLKLLALQMFYRPICNMTVTF